MYITFQSYFRGQALFILKKEQEECKVTPSDYFRSGQVRLTPVCDSLSGGRSRNKHCGQDIV
jgi:hypothetical protein